MNGVVTGNTEPTVLACPKVCIKLLATGSPGSVMCFCSRCDAKGQISTENFRRN